MSNSSSDLAKRLTKAWQKTPLLRSYSKILLVYLVCMEQHFDPIELFNREIEEDTGLGNSQINLAIDDLLRFHIIEVEKAEDSKAKIYKVKL